MASTCESAIRHVTNLRHGRTSVNRGVTEWERGEVSGQVARDGPAGEVTA